jgi:hypothetical protein
MQGCPKLLLCRKTDQQVYFGDYAMKMRSNVLKQVMKNKIITLE